jgi:hypothetical protein
VRPVSAVLLDGVLRVGGLGHDYHVRLIVNNGGNSLAEQGMVIDAENPYTLG